MLRFGPGFLGAAKYLGKRELAPTKRRRPPVVLLQEGTGEMPVYFLNAGLVEFRLAQLMGPGHSVFGVEIPWPSAWRRSAIRNETTVLPTMERIVAPYVAAIRAHAHSSPCVLAGYSFAGLMAFEAAHRIQEQGGKVDMVILLDAPAKYPKDLTPHEIAQQKLEEVWKPKSDQCSMDRTSQSTGSRLRSSLSIAGWMLVKEIRAIGYRFITTVLRDPGQLTSKTDEMGIPLHWRLVERLYENALESHHLRPLDCRGILFRADPNEDERAFRVLGHGLGWDNTFIKGLEIIQVTGNHFTMMDQEAHTLTLAKEIRKLLQRGYSIAPSMHEPVGVSTVSTPAH